MNRLLLRALLVAVCLAGPIQLALAQGSYTGAAVVQPANEQTVHDNDGNVTVRVAVTPGLAPGHRVVLLLDGRPIGQQMGGTFPLSGIERGAHTLQAQVVDSNGKTLIASHPVTFYMWQASRLFPGRRDK